MGAQGADAAPGLIGKIGRAAWAGAALIGARRAMLPGQGMREIVFDTETTGFKPSDGHRLVEIGCVELMNHMPTGRTYHQYINPQRDMPQGAFEVHGLSEQFLSDKPLFPDIADAFLDFVEDAPLVAHNASFDMTFINAELGWANKPTFPTTQAVDTLAIAKRRFPGAPASLDALCRRFNVDNSAREKHGALLDAELLAEVYLELIGGREPGLVLEEKSTGGGLVTNAPATARRSRTKPLPSLLTDDERAAHKAFIAEIGDKALWLKSASD